MTRVTRDGEQVLVVPGTDNKPLGTTLPEQAEAGIQQLVMNFAGEKKAADLPGFRKGTLANQQSNRCLDVPFGDSSKQLRIWDCNNTANQQFEYNPDTQQLKVLGQMPVPG
ncbi:MAG: ricin-type beta-trefoil lectin domain protein [Candidatus Nanopelagicales bacterium]